MAKELLLYGGVNTDSATVLVTQLEESKDEDVVLRINSQGGSPEDMFSMIAKFKEHPKNKKIKIDGMAYSAGLFFCNYAENVECLDVSKGLLHRAAYAEWFEKSEYMTASMWENLDSINKNLRAGFEAKIDVEKYNALGKPSLDDVFSNSQRVDVFLTAKEMKKIGLVDKIIAITPEKKAEINSAFVKIAASYTAEIQEENEDSNKQKTDNIMDKNELKAKHPAVYAELVKEGAEAEAERAKSWMVFNDVDPKAVAEGIASGKNISVSQVTELTRKSVSAEMLGKLGAEGAKEITAEGADKTEKEKNAAAFAAEFEKESGLKL